MTSDRRLSTAQNVASAGRYLDLSYEGRQRAKSTVSNNGFRPHGGYRGTKVHPPSLYSFNKSTDFQNGLASDIEQMYITEQLSEHGSPSWLVPASREPNYSEESMLFQNHLLAPSRVEQNFPLHFRQACLHPANRSKSATYYRANTSHAYLSATELNKQEMRKKSTLGRPTRTTLLRARQRCGSAPINAYEVRREIQKRNEQTAAFKHSLLNNLSHSMKDILATKTPDGENMHSFLVGARYNKPHVVDAKGLTDYGVYMPRNNPNGCFLANAVHKKIVQRQKENPNLSPEPLDSAGCSDRSDSPSPPPTPNGSISSQRPKSAPCPHKTAQMTPRATLLAWAEPVPVNAKDEEPSVRHTGTSPRRAKDSNTGNMNLAVKGTRHHGTKARPVRPASSISREEPRKATRKNHQEPDMPGVYIQGTNIPTRPQKEPRGSVTGDHHKPVAPRRAGSLTVREIAQRVNMGALYEKASKDASTMMDSKVGAKEEIKETPNGDDGLSIQKHTDIDPDIMPIDTDIHQKLNAQQDPDILGHYSDSEDEVLMHAEDITHEAEESVAIAVEGLGIYADREKRKSCDSVVSIIKGTGSGTSEIMKPKKSKVRFAEAVENGIGNDDNTFFITSNGPNEEQFEESADVAHEIHNQTSDNIAKTTQLQNDDSLVFVEAPPAPASWCSTEEDMFIHVTERLAESSVAESSDHATEDKLSSEYATDPPFITGINITRRSSTENNTHDNV